MEGSSVYYNRIINDIRVSIIYSTFFGKYQALFEKQGRMYEPKEAEFKTHTWEGLIDRIGVEMRTDDFAKFLGFQTKKLVFNTIVESRNTFVACP
jgi:hypothetical protein